MAWNKGEQGYRLDHSATELNEQLKAMEGSIKEEGEAVLLLTDKI